MDLKNLKISKKGPCEVTAADIITDGTIEVVNPDVHIAYLGEDGELDIEMTAIKGRGYTSGDKNRDENGGAINTLPIY